MLAKKGYNVFCGNSRGNQYSKGHKTLKADRDNDKYWDFSYYEMAKYDVPAQIDLVLKLTKKKKLTYMGQS